MLSQYYELRYVDSLLIMFPPNSKLITSEKQLLPKIYWLKILTTLHWEFARCNEGNPPSTLKLFDSNSEFRASSLAVWPYFLSGAGGSGDIVGGAGGHWGWGQGVSQGIGIGAGAGGNIIQTWKLVQQRILYRNMYILDMLLYLPHVFLCLYALLMIYIS